jgi:hypothetical protein
MSIPVPLPPASEIDFGTTPGRTKKTITLRVKCLDAEIKDAVYGGNTIKFTQPLHIDVFVRDPTAPGRRQGREPEILVAIEKYLTEFLALHRLALQDLLGIQYAEITATQTFSEIEGGDEDSQTPWYHFTAVVRLHYWMTFAEEATLLP